MSFTVDAEQERKAQLNREAQRRYRQRHPQRVAGRMQRWREANPEDALAISRRYRERHPDRKRDSDARHEAKRRACPDQRAADVQRAKAWRLAHPEQARLHRRVAAQARRARLRGQFVEHVDPLLVLLRDEGVCGICCERVDPRDFHVDHVVPLSRGGEHSYANTQTAHPTCNCRKGAR